MSLRPRRQVLKQAALLQRSSSFQEHQQKSLNPNSEYDLTFAKGMQA